MEGFDEDVYVGRNDVAEENVHGDAMHYGFDGGAPPPPPPMDGLSRNENDGMHSQEDYGFGGGGGAPPTPPPIDGLSRNANDHGYSFGGGGDQEKPYDLAAENDGILGAADSSGPLLPEPSEMREQGSAFREWRRQNMNYLEEKEKKEKELRNQIIAEAEEWKRKFYEKRNQTCETNKAHNREREKLYYSQQEKFHKEADSQFWKAIAEMIPREVPNLEKRRGKKDDEKKPAVFVVQGPKPGKPTDMARMRQILAKVKTNPPLHMRPPPAKEEGKDGKLDQAKSKSSEDGKEKKDGAAGETKSPASPAAKDAAADGAPKTAESSAAEGKEDVEKK